MAAGRGNPSGSDRRLSLAESAVLVGPGRPEPAAREPPRVRASARSAALGSGTPQESGGPGERCDPGTAEEFEADRETERSRKLTGLHKSVPSKPPSSRMLLGRSRERDFACTHAPADAFRIRPSTIT